MPPCFDFYILTSLPFTLRESCSATFVGHPVPGAAAVSAGQCTRCRARICLIYICGCAFGRSPPAWDCSHNALATTSGSTFPMDFTIVPILAQSSCFPNGKVVAEQEGCFFGGVSTNSGFSEALDTKKGMLVNYIYRLRTGKTNPIGSVMMSPAILKEIRLRGCSIADRSR